MYWMWRWSPLVIIISLASVFAVHVAVSAVQRPANPIYIIKMTLTEGDNPWLRMTRSNGNIWLINPKSIMFVEYYKPDSAVYLYASGFSRRIDFDSHEEAQVLIQSFRTAMELEDAKVIYERKPE